MPSAPIGAVMRIARTATERTSCPQGSPIASGTEPIAACTVAFGRYAIIQKRRSFRLKGVPIRQIATPAARKRRAINIILSDAKKLMLSAKIKSQKSSA